MTYTDHQRLAAALSSVTEPGRHELRTLRTADQLAEFFTSLPPPERADAETDTFRRTAAHRLGGQDPCERGESLLKQAARYGGRLVLPHDHEWPSSVDDLNQLHDPHDGHTAAPHALWVRGTLSTAMVARQSVAMVGARAATAYGEYVARDLAFGLASAEWTVISGGALGIDAASHRGALAAGGTTVAILANGIDGTYPPANTSLLESIAETGLLISEWPPGTTPARFRFIIRNRLIAALSQGTVVVEAAQRSGSRVTARRTTELSRPLMAVPGAVTSAMSVGAHDIIRDLRAEIVTSTTDVLEVVAGIGAIPSVSADAAPDIGRQAGERLPPACGQVAGALSTTRPATVADVVALTGLPASQVVASLDLLTRAGTARQSANRSYFAIAGQR